MSQTARGTFAVDISPRPPDPDTEGLGQMQLRKTWSGDVEGTGWGLMISGGDPGAGSAGYVAMEVVEAVVHTEGGDLSGRFALQQLGTMHAGEARQDYVVVPGSGTDALAGIGGTLALSVEDGAHHYVLTFDLPAAG